MTGILLPECVVASSQKRMERERMLENRQCETAATAENDANWRESDRQETMVKKAKQNKHGRQAQNMRSNPKRNSERHKGDRDDDGDGKRTAEVELALAERVGELR